MSEINFSEMILWQDLVAVAKFVLNQLMIVLFLKASLMVKNYFDLR